MMYRLATAAILLCAVGPATAEPAQGVDPPSMRFEWVQEGPAEVCGEHCREWVTAFGPITAETARDFDFFTQVKNVRGATLVLDSGGGSVLASLELGRKVREQGMATTVGHVAPLPSAPGEKARGRFSPRGECASMCAFVLLGGVKRHVPPEARILVHQIWPGTKRYDASAETYTAEEMVRIQRDVGRIARYTVEMGGDIELFEIAMRIPPWERLRSLTQAELRRMGLQNLEMAEAPTSGAAITSRNSRATNSRTAERGWTRADDSASPVLQRQHLLTAEGEELGRFELHLACGESGKSYRLAYAESRTLANEDDPPQLKSVNLLVEGERIPLVVDASAPRGNAAELESRASGAVPAEIIAKLRKDPDAAMIIGTRTSDNVRTSIRVGSTGLGKAFPAFARDCGS